MARPFLTDADEQEAGEFLRDPSAATKSDVTRLASTVRDQASRIEELERELEAAKVRLTKSTEQLNWLAIREPTQSEAEEEYRRVISGASSNQKPWLSSGEIWLPGDWQGHRCDICRSWIFKHHHQVCPSCHAQVELSARAIVIESLQATLLEVLEENNCTDPLDNKSLISLAKVTKHVVQLARVASENKITLDKKGD